MSSLVHGASFAKFSRTGALLHAFYSAVKRVKDALDTKQKSDVRNCGRGYFSFPLHFSVLPLHAPVIASLMPLAACFFLVAYLVGCR